VLRNNSDIDGDGDYAREIMQEKNYYPFGLQQKGYNDLIVSEHKYGFGGKEEQNELGLSWIDITARNYDPALGRWFVVDALAEHSNQIDKSPYAYAWNNPVFFNDPDGNCPKCPKLPGFLNDAFSYLENTTGPAIKKYGRKVGEFLASFNPLVTASTIYKGATEGRDSFNNEMSNGDVGLEIATSLPLTKPLKFVGEGLDVVKNVIKNADNVVEYSLKGADDIVTGSAKLDDGILKLDFNVPGDMKGKGIGKSMFNNSVETFGDNVKGIEGLWGYGSNGKASDNLTSFLNNVDWMGGDLSREAAALNTWTGRQAKKNGFTKAHIEYDDADEVKVLFTKPN
uniref:RHS repeat domain-containing protein n=1 Tax=uncultured Aquimarina sp. TaxID=575652 RepID=UPI00260E5C0F